ncbi:P-loop NTPase [Methanogenium cariaci]|uniref:nucleotide-binding protein n=1 Tax=Methanogenium cariaci TaxID=2197 RepID=UPI000A5D5B13|nr:P-loop NTPase [Methanogenium cariaci]
MKTIICGKGGSGKSTITALLAKTMTARGHSVLVIDTDESNQGLHRQLGLEAPDDFMEYIGGKQAFVQQMMEKMPKGEPLSLFEDDWSLADVPEQYLSKQDGLGLIAIGKIHTFGEGCACPLGALSKNLISRITTRMPIIYLSTPKPESNTLVAVLKRDVTRSCGRRAFI